MSRFFPVEGGIPGVKSTMTTRLSRDGETGFFLLSTRHTSGSTPHEYKSFVFVTAFFTELA